MKFSCNSSALQRGVSVVQNVSQSKIANPIVENILIIAESNQVLFIGTNLTQTLRCCIEAQVDQEGQIAVPGKYLGNLVREIGAGTVLVDLKRNRLNLQ
jgi:DNA polymerase-3 subunit beta